MSTKTWPKSAASSAVSSKRSSLVLDEPATTHWHSIYIASALSFVGTVQFSLYFSSLWPYVQMIDRSIDEKQYGWIIAIYSVGQIISAPLFGWVSNRIRQVRLPLFAGLALMLVGNICYLSLELVPVRKLYVLLLCRFVTGMGSGNVCLLRTYASTASTSKDRSRAIAFVTCGQALGATGGPAFQLMFTFLHYPGVSLLGTGLRFNLYTGPAFLACLMNIVGAVVLLVAFNEHYAGLGEAAVASEEADEEGDVEKSQIKVSIVGPSSKTGKLPPYDLLACSICYLSRFTQMFIQTNLETIGSPYAMMMFAWEEAKAVEITSVAQGLIGGLTFAIYIAYISLKGKKDPNLRVSCVLSFIGLAAFHLSTFSWPFLPIPVATYNESQELSYQRSGSEPQPVGCNTDKFSWCHSLSQVNVWLYYVSYVVCIGLSFPVLNIAMNTLFSHILGPRRQGTQQGIFQMSGSVARLVGPILMSNLYTQFGPTLVWTMELAVIGSTLVLWLLFYGRMVPLLSAKRRKRFGNAKDADDSSTGTSFTRLKDGDVLAAEHRRASATNRSTLALPMVGERRGKLSVTH